MHFLPIVTTTVKFLGSKMGVRLLLLLVAGLGALYTIHLLAQDWMKITAGSKGIGSLLLGKRDLKGTDRYLSSIKQEIQFEQKIDWDKILKRDPFNCALSLVCQLSAGAAKHNKEANQIYEFISHTIFNSNVPHKLKKSFQQGLDYNKNEKENFRKCYSNYPICPYSAETMLKLISFNNVIFG